MTEKKLTRKKTLDKKTLTINAHKDLIEKMRVSAERNRRSVNMQVVLYLEQGLERDGVK